MASTTDPDVAEPRMTVWQSEPCPPWCAHPGHEDRDMVGDRVHQGTLQSVPLHLEQAEEMAEGAYLLDEARAYLEQHDEAAGACVVLMRGDNAGWRMTLSEAKMLAAVLTGLAQEGCAGTH
jgi:hypothetical protein